MGRVWGSRERHGDVGRGARRGGSHSGLLAYCTDLNLWQKRGSQSHLSEMGAPEGPEQRLIGPDLLFNKITPDTVLKIDYGWLGRRRVAGTQTDGVSCQGDGTALRLGVVSLQRRPPAAGTDAGLREGAGPRRVHAWAEPVPAALAFGRAGRPWLKALNGRAGVRLDVLARTRHRVAPWNSGLDTGRAWTKREA